MLIELFLPLESKPFRCVNWDAVPRIDDRVYIDARPYCVNSVEWIERIDSSLPFVRLNVREVSR